MGTGDEDYYYYYYDYYYYYCFDYYSAPCEGASDTLLDFLPGKPARNGDDQETPHRKLFCDM